LGARLKPVLVIAAVDPTAGLGLLADLKTLAAFGVHGYGVVTALMIRSPRGGEEVHAVSPELLEAQLEAAVAEIRPAAVKVGAVGRAEHLKVVARMAAELDVPVVLDPALRSARGAALLDDAGIAVFREELARSCALVTPNLAEASALAGLPVADRSAMERAAEAIAAHGARAVLVKGGLLEGEPADLLWEAGRARWFSGSRIEVEFVGAGCALSSAIAAELALGRDLLEAVGQARAYVQALFESAMAFGDSGPVLVDHLAPFRARAFKDDELA
jgi:hydroxymethylpyrimidine/phosphomethylpyrimidine kinase